MASIHTLMALIFVLGAYSFAARMDEPASSDADEILHPAATRWARPGKTQSQVTATRASELAGASTAVSILEAEVAP